MMQQATNSTFHDALNVVEFPTVVSRTGMANPVILNPTSLPA